MLLLIIQALTITDTSLGVPYYDYSRIGPNTLYLMLIIKAPILCYSARCQEQQQQQQFQGSNKLIEKSSRQQRD